MRTRYLAYLFVALACSSLAVSQVKENIINDQPGQKQSASAHKKEEKMKVEIWSDVMCPFCYIGKRKFETALSQFAHGDSVEVTWKSFQLNPDMKTDPSKSTIDYLSEVKGWSKEQARQTTAHVTNMAKEVGLSYNFDKAVVANSFDAHRFIQLAKKHNKGDAAEEALFKAYFTDGKNTADHAVLAALGEEIGLDAALVKHMLAGNDLSEAVHHDLSEAQQLGITGVPFFVINRKYAVSGAQPSETFLGALNKAWSEQPLQNISSAGEGASCTPAGECK